MYAGLPQCPSHDDHVDMPIEEIDFTKRAIKVPDHIHEFLGDAQIS